MEDQEKLKKGIGDKEPKKLETGKVRVLGAKIEHIEKAKQDIVIFMVKHPDKEDPLDLSKAKVLRKGDKLKVIGLWYQLDEDENIQKGTALAEVMSFYDIPTLEEATGKEVETVEDEEGYLCLKAYK